MSMDPPFDQERPHRKRVQHFNVPRQAHLLTFSCYHRQPLLLDERRCRLLGEGLTTAVVKQEWVLMAFVFMPEHVHLVAAPWREGAGVSEFLYAIKRPVSYRIKTKLEAIGDPLLQELTIRERPGKMSFRFWQEGPGHDVNLDDGDAIGDAVAYVHRNPVRRGLCGHPGDWKWSSAAQYLGNEVAVGAPRVCRFSRMSGLKREGCKKDGTEAL